MIKTMLSIGQIKRSDRLNWLPDPSNATANKIIPPSMIKVRASRAINTAAIAMIPIASFVLGSSLFMVSGIQGA